MGKATPTHAFSRCRSWHRGEHMGKNVKAVYRGAFSVLIEMRQGQLAFVLIEKVMMMN